MSDAPLPLADAGGVRAPVVAGLVAALVGFTSSFAVVIAGLRAVGATPAQAASGLVALCLVFGLVMLALATWTRLPLSFAWSTPGAALLVSTGTVDGGWSAAVGAFAVTGVLLALTGLVPALGRLIGRIPVPLAQAMLAGVLLQLCLAPFVAVADSPALIAPILVVWLVATRWLPVWAVPIAFVVALGVMATDLRTSGASVPAADLVPSLTWTTPSFTVAAVVGIAIPLTVVTMASQNIPGVAVMASFGFRVPWTPSMVAAGAGTAVVAPFGGHAMNLAALSAALTAGDGAGPRDRRWIAAATAGVAYLVLAPASAALVALSASAAPGIVESVAGLALLAAFTAAIRGSLDDTEHRTSSAVAFLVAASGITIAGVGGAFWALVLGLAVRAVIERAAPAGTTTAAP
ncbi:MAG: benzoate/H(+) symporter BenE family transporter [Aeromicrobium sp.]|uniref:benzoate/H(+) symporter BenE family transporter n=1 Tax=Aeromicrobium sp. TaxID=1871063 RepID=UPI0025BB1B32|nr:benzoate/H(+) symporter BenE family transporter [Aeromicrobium sp.]MDF1703410.1 benzoate/H(+) symporter BenE family transporter [Aeromicrobium sp.]